MLTFVTSQKASYIPVRLRSTKSRTYVTNVSALASYQLLLVLVGCTVAVANALCDPKLWMVHACLALLGGSFQVRRV